MIDASERAVSKRRPIRAGRGVSAKIRRALRIPVALVGAAALVATGYHIGATSSARSSSARSAGSTGTGWTMPTGEPAISAVTHITAARQIVLPIDAYLETPEQRGTVERAEAFLGAECMRGLKLEPFVSTAASTGGQGSGIERRYGVFDAQTAARFGYHAPPVANPGPTGKPGQSSSGEQPGQSPSGEQLAAWSGGGPSELNGRPIPEGGCRGEADRRLSGGALMVNLDIPERLSGELYRQSQQDSRVLAVFRAWSECMGRSGYAYPSPMNAVDDPRFSAPNPTTQEIAVASADVACKQQTNLVGEWLAVETAYQHRAIKANAAQFDAIKKLIDARAHNAARVLETMTADSAKTAGK